MRWLRKDNPDLAAQFATVGDNFWQNNGEALNADLSAAALRYFTKSDRPDGWPNDPVARFHLGNGAILENIHCGGDTSAKGIEQAGGMMVNYRYDLGIVEANHEAFQKTKSVPLSPSLKKALKS